MENAKSKNRPVFSLSEKMIKKISADQSISASEVCALMTVACFTDKSGIYSTAGAKAVRNTLAVGNHKAEELLAKLRKRGFIHDPKTLKNIELKAGMPNRSGRAMVRWILKPDNSRRVWFSASLVRGCGRWSKPLQTLRGCGDLAARLLLSLYIFEDSMTYGGISPLSVYKKYSTYFVQNLGDRRYDLYNTVVDESRVCFRLYADILGIRKTASDDSLKSFWSALRQLEKRGFIYECLTIFTGTKINEDMCFLYPLHTYNRYGRPPKGEESIAPKMHKVACEYDCPVADESGRFYGRFAFISDEEQPVQAVGIYRLRFRNASPAFEEISQSWKNMRAARSYWEGEVSYILTGERVRS